MIESISEKVRMKRQPTPKRLARIQKVVANRTRDIVVVLENIHDPHNAAAILRSADACGIQDVYFIFEGQKPYNPAKVGKVSSSSANKWLTFHIFRTAVECLEELRSKGYTIVSTLLDPEAKSLYELCVSNKKIALVVGNEHVGISQSIKEMSDVLVYIPMRGFVESLNVSVAAAVSLFEIVRQQNEQSVKYKLSEVEQQLLVQDFLSR